MHAFAGAWMPEETGAFNEGLLRTARVLRCSIRKGWFLSKHDKSHRHPKRPRKKLRCKQLLHLWKEAMHGWRWGPSRRAAGCQRPRL